MKLEDLLNDPIMRLPKSRPASGTYYHYILDVMSEYIAKLKEVDFVEVMGSRGNPTLIGASGKPVTNIDLIVLIAQQTKNSIVFALQDYLEGRPHIAFSTLNDGLREGYFSPSAYFSSAVQLPGKGFYRMQQPRELIVPPKRLFHIPMDKREWVGTNRFSIPGHPCLYMADSSYLCWLESRKPDDIANCYMSYFKVEPDTYALDMLVLLDLTNQLPSFIETIKKGRPLDGKIIKFLSLWPLIAACSVKVPNDNVSFKPEYIIPQLVLHGIREETLFQSGKPFTYLGVKFSSSHFDLHSGLQIGDAFNIAIPIRNSTQEPYCNYLVDRFKLTSPVSWKDIGWDNSKTIERSIAKFEHCSLRYDDSLFGEMDAHLKTQDLVRINSKGDIVV